MPVQKKSNSKSSTRPHLATPLLQIRISSKFNIDYCVKKGKLHFIHVLEDVLLGNVWLLPHKVIEIFACPKKQVFSKLQVQKTGCTGPG